MQTNRHNLVSYQCHQGYKLLSDQCKPIGMISSAINVTRDASSKAIHGKPIGTISSAINVTRDASSKAINAKPMGTISSAINVTWDTSS